MHRETSRRARIPPHVQQPGRPAELLPRHPGRRRRHRGAGLGRHAAAHVPALLRAQGLQGEVLEESEGDVAGIKSATIKSTGDYAYGTAAHRNRRAPPGAQVAVRLERPPPHLFARVFVYPEVDDSIEIDINPADVRTDTYRASGAGGQHINKTDSAVRLTHIPTGIVVQCQNDRSSTATATWPGDAAKPPVRARDAQAQAEQQKLEDAKTDIGWGHQIRSYVLDHSRIKDLRTNVEVGNTQKVLDGDLDPSSRPA
jgi:peptide chain release factor 2